MPMSTSTSTDAATTTTSTSMSMSTSAMSDILVTLSLTTFSTSFPRPLGDRRAR